MPPERHHEVVVVGGGAAGVSGALECFDIQLDVVLVEALPLMGGQLAEVPNSVRNVAAGRFESGEALRRSLEGSAAILGERVLTSCSVTGADLEHGRVETGMGPLIADAVLVATGSRKQRLPSAVDGAFGGDVTYLIDSDPRRFAGRPVTVVGGGDSATLDALALARAGSRVTLVHRSEGLTARRDVVDQVRGESLIEDLPGWELDSVRGADRLEEVVLVRRSTGERRTLAAGGLVVKISRMPSTEAFSGQLTLDRHGAIVVDDDLSTSRPGVFAAGDVVSGAYARVATAMGQGVLAARSILRFLEGRP